MLRACLREGFRQYETAAHSLAVAHSTMHAHRIILVAGESLPGYNPARIRCTTASSRASDGNGFIFVDFSDHSQPVRADRRYADRMESGHTHGSRPLTGRGFEPYPRHQFPTALSAVGCTKDHSRPLPSTEQMPSRRPARQHSTDVAGPGEFSHFWLTSHDPQFMADASMRVPLVADARCHRHRIATFACKQLLACTAGRER